MPYLHIVPKLSMSGAVSPFPQYVFMLWKWTLYLRFYNGSDCQVIVWNYVNAQEEPYSLYIYQVHIECSRVVRSRPYVQRPQMCLLCQLYDRRLARLVDQHMAQGKRNA